MEVFNRASALERVGGDTERLGDLLEDFQMRIPVLIKAMENAVSKKRASRLAQLSVELRDSATGIGAEGMVGLAEQMGDVARAEDFVAAEALLTHMGMELDWLSRVLDENRCSGNL